MTYPNVELQEMVRAFYYGWYQDMVTVLPEYRNGYLTPPSTPGLGTALQPEVSKRSDVAVRWSRLD